MFPKEVAVYTWKKDYSSLFLLTLIVLTPTTANTELIFKQKCDKCVISPNPWRKREWIDSTFLLVQSYLPTPPIGQDMTQGQFLSGV